MGASTSKIPKPGERKYLIELEKKWKHLATDFSKTKTIAENIEILKAAKKVEIENLEKFKFDTNKISEIRKQYDEAIEQLIEADEKLTKQRAKINEEILEKAEATFKRAHQSSGDSGKKMRKKSKKTRRSRSRK